MNVGSLFSGIGGLDLGLERAGMQVRWQCEIEPYCRAVLARHWPDVPCYEDIRDIDGGAEPVDLICGGFPCQPVSLAGKGLAQKDPRWLWPEFARVVGDLRPRYVLVENVPGLVKRGLDLVVTGLAEMGYDAEWEIVSAAACGAPHLRERLFIVAYSNADSRGLQVHAELNSDAAFDSPDGDSRGPHTDRLRDPLAYAESQRFQGTVFHGKQTGDFDAPYRSWWKAEPALGRVADGLPNRVAQLRALGNAVVPQVAEAVGRMIMEAA